MREHRYTRCTRALIRVKATQRASPRPLLDTRQSAWREGTTGHRYTRMTHTPELCNLRSAMAPAQIGGGACKRPRDQIPKGPLPKSSCVCVWLPTGLRTRVCPGDTKYEVRQWSAPLIHPQIPGTAPRAGYSRGTGAETTGPSRHSNPLAIASRLKGQRADLYYLSPGIGVTRAETRIANVFSIDQN